MVDILNQSKVGIIGDVSDVTHWIDDRLGLWLRLECSLDSLSIDSAHVI